MSIYDCMKNLISNKFYGNKKEVVDRLNAFLAYKVITVEQYQELMDLAEQKYGIEN
nr:MAG TPA: hypothetical protein [Caudoviricetes sp.]